MFRMRVTADQVLGRHRQPGILYHRRASGSCDDLSHPIGIPDRTADEDIVRHIVIMRCFEGARGRQAGLVLTEFRFLPTHGQIHPGFSVDVVIGLHDQAHGSFRSHRDLSPDASLLIRGDGIGLAEARGFSGGHGAVALVARWIAQDEQGCLRRIEVAQHARVTGPQHHGLEAQVRIRCLVRGPDEAQRELTHTVLCPGITIGMRDGEHRGATVAVRWYGIVVERFNGRGDLA